MRFLSIIFGPDSRQSFQLPLNLDSMPNFKFPIVVNRNTSSLYLFLQRKNQDGQNSAPYRL